MCTVGINSAADRVVQIIKRVLELSSTKDTLVLLRRSLQLKTMHLSRVARRLDV